MANDAVLGRVLIIDTAAVIYGPSGSLGTVPIQLGKIVWSGMSSGNVLQIEDENGKIIYKVTAGAANNYYDFDFKGLMAGFEVATIAGGTLLVYPYMGNF